MPVRHATKQVSWALQCEGKVGHADRRAARRARNATRGGSGHLSIYRCPWCDRFHIGHAWIDPYVSELEERTLARRLEAEAAADIELAVARALHLDPDAAREILERLSNPLDE